MVLDPPAQAGRTSQTFADLEQKILSFIDEWNEIAHPFKWTTKSFDKVLNAVDGPWTRRRPHWTDTLKAAA
ncbi:MAG: hypothetical protein M4D80_00875 [Myxococcota bacterium]|nr:hypothetical protein [Myxococcota bacterium]